MKIIKIFIAIIATIFIYATWFVLAEALFDWKYGGGAIPMVIIFSIVALVWRKIIKTTDKESGNIEITYKDILAENGMSEYIPIFERNKLEDLDIILKLIENDYEKIGIIVLGDRKKLLNIFTKGEIKRIKTLKKKIDLEKNKVKQTDKTENNESKIIVYDKTIANNQIRIKRLESVVGCALYIDIKIDNDIHKLGNGEEIIINIDNGKHIISATFNNDYERIEFEINNNSRTYLIQIKPPLKLWEDKESM